MSRAYATPLELELFPSKQQSRLLLFIHTLVAISILLLPWHLLWRLLFFVCVLLLSLYFLHREQPFKRIVWHSGNHWLLAKGDVSSKAVLLPETLVSLWLVILLLRLENGKRCSIVIWPDSVQSDVFRRLRVRLKIEGESLLRVNEELR